MTVGANGRKNKNNDKQKEKMQKVIFEEKQEEIIWEGNVSHVTL